MNYCIDEWLLINNPLLGNEAEMKIISSDNVTVGKVAIHKNMDLACHSHVHEQITIVLEGEMMIEFGGHQRVVGKDQVCIIPGNEPHTVKITKTPFQSFDIFSPAKEDFIQNALAYLKHNVKD